MSGESYVQRRSDPAAFLTCSEMMGHGVTAGPPAKLAKQCRDRSLTWITESELHIHVKMFQTITNCGRPEVARQELFTISAIGISADGDVVIIYMIKTQL